MTATKNPFGKTRKVDEPYAVYRGHHGWEWRVLKTYQRPDKEEGNLYARWLCAVKSPYTFDSFEMGDTYVHEVLVSGLLVDASQEWVEHYVDGAKPLVTPEDIARENRNDDMAAWLGVSR